MKMRSILLLGVFLYLIPNSFAFQSNAQVGAKAISAYGQLPLSFEANRGQAPTEVKFGI